MEWIKYECEDCDRRFAVEEEPSDRLDEPRCPECGGTNCIELETHAPSPIDLIRYKGRLVLLQKSIRRDQSVETQAILQQYQAFLPRPVRYFYL